MSHEPWSETLALLTKPKAALLGAPLLAIAALGTIAFGISGPEPTATPATVGITSSVAPPTGQPLKIGQLELISPAQAQTGAAPAAGNGAINRAAVESIVREYLLKNPEILVEMSEELERRRTEQQSQQQKTVILQNKDALFNSKYDYVFGDEKGDVNVVEYFDYNCAWCKRALDQVQQLVAQDKKVRVIMKEMPIFGEDSMFAAKAAMASKKQGKYWPFHVALMRQQRVTKESALKVAADLGIDVEQLQKDMQDPAFDKAIAETMQVAEALQIQGTPGFIVDTKVNVGFVPLDGLKALVAETRKTGCKTC